MTGAPLPKLSPAQRRALVERRSQRVATTEVLLRLNLIYSNRGIYRLTPEGMRVRSILLAEQSKEPGQ